MNTICPASPSTPPDRPRYIIYYNSEVSPLSAVADTPYTHVILSFLTASVDPEGQVQLHVPTALEPLWETVPKLQARGKKVLISFGGGTFQSVDYSPLRGHENALAMVLADFVRQHGLDGIDIDYEASDSFFIERKAGVLDGRAFLIALNRALRAALPAPDYSISHAPQPPYLSHGWHDGPYWDVLTAVGDEIDWIAVQYYNNPGFDSPIQNCVVGEGAAPFATSFLGLVDPAHSLRWPAQKLVVGKPVYHADANTGHISPQDLIEQVITPLRTQFGDAFGGIMGWQFSTLTDDHRLWNTIVGQALLQPLASLTDMNK